MPTPSMGFTELAAAGRPIIEAILAMALLIAVVLARQSTGREAHKRGAKIRDGRAAQRRTARLQRLQSESLLTIAGVGIPPDDEVKHFKLIGTTGTGKSTVIRELLAVALDRGDRAVITDPGGEYLARFHDPGRGDVILNPFDSRSVQWDPFAEVRLPYDAEQLASSLIPSTEDASGREWRGYARTFLTAVVRRCHEVGRHDAAELWRLLAMAPSTELRPVVAGTPAQPFLEPENARMFGSIRSVAGRQRRRWSTCAPSARGPSRCAIGSTPVAAHCSCRIRRVRSRRCAPLSRRGCGSRSSRQSGAGTDRRLWLVVDELDALGPSMA